MEHKVSVETGRPLFCCTRTDRQLQMFVIGHALFIVTELKLTMETEDNIAQLFLELLCSCFFLLLSESPSSLSGI